MCWDQGRFISDALQDWGEMCRRTAVCTQTTTTTTSLHFPPGDGGGDITLQEKTKNTDHCTYLLLLMELSNFTLSTYKNIRTSYSHFRCAQCSFLFALLSLWWQPNFQLADIQWGALSTRICSIFAVTLQQFSVPPTNGDLLRRNGARLGET